MKTSTTADINEFWHAIKCSLSSPSGVTSTTSTPDFYPGYFFSGN
jgi:hypothetical protein